MARTGERGNKRPASGGRGPAREYSRSWMAGWVESADGSHSVKQACDAAGISLSEYLRGRLEDPGFDAAALVLDQVLDLMVLSSVRNAAIEGDGRAQVLYYGKARLPAFVPGFASWRGPERREPGAETIAPHVAEAMVAAALAAGGREGEGG